MSVNTNIRHKIDVGMFDGYSYFEWNISSAQLKIQLVKHAGMKDILEIYYIAKYITSYIT